MLAIWLGVFDRPTSSPSPPQPQSAASGEDVRESKPAKTNASGFFSPRTRPAVSATNDVAGTNAPVTTNLITNWDEKIDALLKEESDPNAKAKQLLEMFPRFPEEGQAEAIQHIANLLADEDYNLLATYFTNATTTVEIQDVILADLLSRPNGIKLPLLLEAARTPQHPKAAEAKELLELYLEKDHGTDWNVWQQQLEAWLKENPD